jgi:hypothetical protein
VNICAVIIQMGNVKCSYVINYILFPFDCIVNVCRCRRDWQGFVHYYVCCISCNACAFNDVLICGLCTNMLCCLYDVLYYCLYCHVNLRVAREQTASVLIFEHEMYCNNMVNVNL